MSAGGMSAGGSIGRRAARALSLRRFVRRLIAEWRAGRPAEDCLADLSRRFAQEADET